MIIIINVIISHKIKTTYLISMITPEAWTPVIINSQCSSIKWIERSTEYVLPRIQVFILYVIYFSQQEEKLNNNKIS